MRDLKDVLIVSSLKELNFWWVLLGRKWTVELMCVLACRLHGVPWKEQRTSED